MKKTVKKLLSLALMTTMLATVAIGALPATAESYDNTLTLTINGTDCSTEGKNIVLYPNDSDSVRAIKGNQYRENNFRQSKIMIFDKNGFLIEAGGDLYNNSSSVTGSPQEYIYIPAGGFAVVFNPYSVSNLFKCFNTAMEGAVLYNATMSVIYEVVGSYSGNTLTIKYNDPEEPAKDAKKFLFVGNSSTYFNGTPIKFKGLAQSAGVDVDVVYCTYGSAFLSEFANEGHERGKAFRNHLKNTEFDYVVLQDGGTATYSDSKPTMSVLLPLIEENGAEALLYMRYSSNSVPANRFESAKKHYINYTRLSREHGLTCAPAASAFLICTDKYPEINLYADDNSHHSKEGSYLIACVMLMTYLGVDPVGVEYDAQLGPDIASKLQECAKIACVDGYDYKVSEEDLATPEDTYYINGTKYENIALKKPYTTNGAAYTGKWTEHNEDGSLIGKYTDGILAEANGESLSIGCVKGNEINVDIDLQGKYNIKAFKTQLFGNPEWGIPDPFNEAKNIKVSFSYSNDGKNYISLGEATRIEAYADGNWTKAIYTLEPEENIEAKYVRATFYNNGFLWCDEISVYGIEGGNIALNKEHTVSGVGYRTDSYSANLTDGVASEKLTYDKGAASTWFGFYNNGNNPTNAPDKFGTVTFDFEKLHTINKVRVHTFFGNTSGIQSPEYISVEVSSDGVTFNEVGKNSFEATSDSSIEWTELNFETSVEARYVRVCVKLRNTFAFINEIEIYGEEYQDITDPEYILGDVNNNGEIEKYDYIAVKRAVMGTLTLNEAQQKAADVNKKDGVEKYDYILVKRHVMGTYTIEG